MKPSDDKFVITKAPWYFEVERWVVWFPIGQRWITNPDGSRMIRTAGAGVPSFDAARRLVARRLREMV